MDKKKESLEAELRENKSGQNEVLATKKNSDSTGRDTQRVATSQIVTNENNSARINQEII